MMKTSIDGMLAIIAEEAIVLESYLDSGGVRTIGVGHTAAAGGMKPAKGDKISVEQALALFADDLRKFEARVLKHIKGPLQQHELDGFVSFDFNTGKIDAGTVDDLWNKGDREGAMRVLKSYKKDKGKVLPALVARREREANMIMNGVYPPVTHVRIDVKLGRKTPWPARTIRDMLVQQGTPAPKPAELPTFDDIAPHRADDVPLSKAEKTAGTGAAVIVTGAGAGLFGLDWKWILAVMAAVAVGAVVGVLLVKGNDNGQR